MPYQLKQDAQLTGCTFCSAIIDNASNRVRSLIMAVILTLSETALAEPAGKELPTGGQVTSGLADISSNGATMDIYQSSQSVSINWATFNIGSQAKVEIHQPNASAIAVNRILDADGSRIMGQLKANGQVYLINPNGVLFGQGSKVDVGGLVASTLNISDADIAAGKRTFSGSGGAVTNKGTITAADGGYVALLGGQVSNEGTIIAKLGTVALAAGDQITLDFNGDKLLNVTVDKNTLNALVKNKQLIKTDGGTVILTDKAAKALIEEVVNHEGIIEASHIEKDNDKIKLVGEDNDTANAAGKQSEIEDQENYAEVHVTENHKDHEDSTETDADSVVITNDIDTPTDNAVTAVDASPPVVATIPAVDTVTAVEVSAPIVAVIPADNTVAAVDVPVSIPAVDTVAAVDAPAPVVSIPAVDSVTAVDISAPVVADSKPSEEVANNKDNTVAALFSFLSTLKAGSPPVNEVQSASQLENSGILMPLNEAEDETRTN